jgi:hypothetical protein
LSERDEGQQIDLSILRIRLNPGKSIDISIIHLLRQVYQTKSLCCPSKNFVCSQPKDVGVRCSSTRVSTKTIAFNLYNLQFPLFILHAISSIRIAKHAKPLSTTDVKVLQFFYGILSRPNEFKAIGTILPHKSRVKIIASVRHARRARWWPESRTVPAWSNVRIRVGLAGSVGDVLMATHASAGQKGFWP